MEVTSRRGSVVAAVRPNTQTSTTAPQPASHSSPKRSDIEALRAVAILLVVAFHCGIRAIPGGFIGVDVFYVLSGYLITGLLVAEISRTSRLDLLQFYARRIRRLLPASFLVTMMTLLAAVVIFAPQELSLAAKGARASSLYISNMFFAASAADYFAPRVASNPFLHTWSLAVEEQFYLFWPLLIMLGLLACRSKRILTGILIGLTLLSMVMCVWLTSHSAVFAFYALPSRAWEFGIGGLAALLPRGSLRLSRNGWLAVGWLGSTVLIGSSLVITSDNAFPGWIALVPVLATACTLVAGAEEPHRGVGRLFDVGPLQQLGALSYSWYLWHWPFLVLCAALLPGASAFAKIGAAAAALGVAHFTHRYYENPIRFSSYLVRRPTLTLSLGAATTAVSIAAAILVLRFADDLAELPGMAALSAAHDDIALMSRKQCVSTDGSSAVKTCTFGPSDAAASLVLFGDSHAIQWFDALRRVTLSHGWKLTTVVKSACAAADISPDRGPLLDAECLLWREKAVRQVVALRPSAVFMASATNKLGRQTDPSRSADADDLTEVREGTRRILNTFHDSGLRVVLVRDNPEFSFDVPICLARSSRHPWYPNSDCELPVTAVLDPAIFEAEKSAVQDLPNVRLVDLTDLFCEKGMCRAMHNGLVMYRDSDHLTGRFTASLADIVEEHILAVMRGNSPDQG